MHSVSSSTRIRSRVLSVVCTESDVRSEVSAAKRDGRTVGVVPTMGALHAGHAALIAAGAKRGRVVVSIFVNPTQFGPGEDYERYPRDPAADLRFAREHGADEVWQPRLEEVRVDLDHGNTRGFNI